jgi:hypothetical protein
MRFKLLVTFVRVLGILLFAHLNKSITYQNKNASLHVQ